MKRTITLLTRQFVPLRWMNWGEDLLFNRINVKLKCTVFILSNIFSHSDILNFETKLFPIAPLAKINSCKSFNLNLFQQQKFLCTADFSRRSNFGQKNHETNKWSFNSKHCVTAPWEMKKGLTDWLEKLLQGGWEFSSGKKQLFALKLSERNQFKHLVVSSRQQLTRLQCV